MIPAKEIDGELWIKAADLPVCPTCEYHKKRAQMWRDEAYKLAGHPMPERDPVLEEREACAKMLEAASKTGKIISCTTAAKAIRARGQA